MCRVIGIIFIGIFLNNCVQQEHSSAYWIWAGIDVSSLPEKQLIYLLQGKISNLPQGTVLVHRGVYPHKTQAQVLMLVYRSSTLDINNS